MFASTLALLGTVVGRVAPWAPRALLLPVPIFGLLLLRTYASEAFLYALLCVVLLAVLQRMPGQARPLRSFAFGALCGLLFLARLDAMFMAAAFMVALLARSEDRSVARLLAQGGAWTGGFLLVAAPYLVFNLIRFGHVVPISGAIKTTFPSVSFVPARLHLQGVICLGFAVLLGIVLVVRRGWGQERWVFLPLIAGAILQSAYVVMLTDHDTGWIWYYVPGLLCGAVLTALAVESGMLVRVVQWAGVVFLVATPIAAAERYVPELRGHVHATRWQVQAARYLARAVPDSAGILVADWPGVFAFYSDRRVLSTDGLTADYRYNDDVVREGIAGFCKRRNISYYVGFDFEYPRLYKGHVNRIRDGVQEVSIYAPLTRRPAGVLTLPDSSRLVRFAELFPDHDARIWNMALWKLD